MANSPQINQRIAFKETLQPDIMVVHQMLTTGYDVNRLKKMYLLRNAKEHTLLQTISRVNRPYKSPAGKTYQYGYIVDFVDISEEYDRTIVNLSSTPTTLMEIISNKEIVEILYEFLKTKIEILDMSKLAEAMKDFVDKEEYKTMVDLVVKVQDEIKRNRNHNQISMVKLDEVESNPSAD